MDSRASNLTDLVERYYAILYRYAYRLTGRVADAEDLTQTVFLTAHAKWHQLQDAAKTQAWLFAIARNAFLKDRRRPVCLVMPDLADVPGDDAPGAALDFDEEQLQQALNCLPEEFRSPVILFYFEDFSYREIAEHMGVAIGTIMSRLARARAFLRKRLGTIEPVTGPQRPDDLPAGGTRTRPVTTARVS